MTTALTFNDVTLSPVQHQGSLWIRAAELARALGYSRENSVSRLYRNNADEFTPDMTQVLEISEGTDSVLTVKTRIFSLRGCHLLAMFARTPIAKAFRKWVLDLLDRLDREKQPAAIPQTTTPSTAESRKPLRALVHAWSQVTGVHHAALWPQVKAHFQLSRIDDLPEEWIPDALAWVQQKIDEAGRALPPAPEPRQLPVPVEGDKALQRLHSTREFCRFDFLPRAYRANDQTAARRFRLAEDLYKLQDCLWAALYNVCSAAQRIRDEA